MKFVPFAAFFIFNAIDIVLKLFVALSAAKHCPVLEPDVAYKKEIADLITLFIGNLFIFVCLVLGIFGIFLLLQKP